MTENAYKKMADTGIANLVLGIVMIVHGARLIKAKSELTF